MLTIGDNIRVYNQQTKKQKDNTSKHVSTATESFIYSDVKSKNMQVFQRGLLNQFVSFKGINAVNLISFASNEITPLQKETIKAIVNIFETGKPLGDYSQVTLLKNDPGHLTYGRSQTTLASGNLYLLIKSYCDKADDPTVKQKPLYADEFKPYLEKLAKKDLSLDNDQPLKALLKKAGSEKLMQKTQDEFFDRAYYDKAHKRAKSLGITTPLGLAVVYDSYVHGSFQYIYDRANAKLGQTPQEAGENKWIKAYVDERYNWLQNHSNSLLRKTVYRMTSFKELINGNMPPIYLTDPPQKGDHIKKVQLKLKELSYNVLLDGVYDITTKQAVMEFQKDHKLTVDGWIANQTYNALGITDGNCQLDLPLKVHGRLITADLFDLTIPPPVIIDEPVDPEEPVKPVPDTPDASDPQANRPLLFLTKPLMKNDSVKLVQTALQRRGYKVDTDGVFGAATDRIIKLFQKHNGLKQDGIIGKQSYETLRIGKDNTYAPEYPDIKLTSQKPYQEGDHIAEVQNILLNKGYNISQNGGVDGVYGPETCQVVKKFQKDHKLTPDGWVGSKTYKALGLGA